MNHLKNNFFSVIGTFKTVRIEGLFLSISFSKHFALKSLFFKLNVFTIKLHQQNLKCKKLIIYSMIYININEFYIKSTFLTINYFNFMSLSIQLFFLDIIIIIIF